MKSIVSFAALAAGVAATGFRNVPPFPIPDNTDNKCNDVQKPGFSFEDLTPGPFGSYGDFDFKGFTCGDFGGGRFKRRTGQKFIGGLCGSTKQSSPSFGCGPKIPNFSLGSIHVEPEFDCDLEFHYDMPDGSTCKHRNACKKSGTTVVNSQCGGARNVTIVFPPQPNKPKPACSIVVPTISFDCNPPKTVTKPVTTTSAAPTAPTLPPPVTTKPTVPPPVDTKPTVPPPAETKPPGPPPPVDTKPTVPPPTETKPPGPPPPPVDTKPTIPPPAETKPPGPPPPPVDTKPTVPPPAETKPPGPPPPGPPTTTTAPVNTLTTTVSTTEITQTTVTTFQSTSTIFTTVVSTITSCGPEVPVCPGNGATTVIVTVPISTTICPVTETQTNVVTSTTKIVRPPGPPGPPGTDRPPVPPPNTDRPPVPPPNTDRPPVPPVTTPTGTFTTLTTTGNLPVETLPCPNVVPACLNTFMFLVNCKDNSDHQCYCPDSAFVKSVFDCLYSHGQADEIISEAVSFFQGLCAPFIPRNPEIGVGATITKYLTVTAPVTRVAPVYTTVVIDNSVVMPVTDDRGIIVPNRSTTIAFATTIAVPQVGFQTESGFVGVIPVTQPPQFVEAPTRPVNGPITAITPGAGRATRPPVVTAGSGHASAGLGLSLAMAVLVVAAL